MTDDLITKVAYLDMLDGLNKIWEIEVNVKGNVVTFKVDTGTEVTYSTFGNQTPLKSAGLSPFGLDQTPLNLQ